MTEPKIIVLDCDEVMVDYNKAWGHHYFNFFNLPIPSPNPHAYYATEYWSVDWKGRRKERQEFEDHFTTNGWRNMHAVEGAVEATHILHDMGFKIFVVSRMPKSAEDDRAANLTDLNFKFDAVIGTGHPPHGNPKKPYIEALKPKYFADDLIANFSDIDKNIPTEFVWIDVGKRHDENMELRASHTIHHTHPNLLDFVKKVVKP